MRISDFKIEFNKFLKEEYPESEINSFFTILTQAYLGMSRLEVAMNPHRELSTGEEQLFLKARQKLISHNPIQYITGQQEFFGYTFKVDENVLIPRPETEELVQWILDDFKINTPRGNPQILDIGTGSGCIAISLAKEIPAAKVTAVDISEEALQIAEMNSEINKAGVNFKKADVLKISKIEGKYDIIVSNPPYVRELEKEKMQANVLNFEPETALYVKDEDPLLFYREITKLAKLALKNRGALYFEINQYLAEETQLLLKKEGFETELKKDIFGNFRMIKGSWN